MKKSVLMRMIVCAVTIVMTVGLASGLSSCNDLLSGLFRTTTTITPNEQNKTTTPSDEQTQITTPSDDPTHVHSIVVDKAVAPTCSKTGLTEGKHCSTCNEVIVMPEIVPTLEHQYKNYVCLVCGAEDHTKYFEFKLLDDGTYAISDIKSDYPISLVIPSTYSGKSVTTIEAGAFMNCTTLTNVTIPNSITSIGMLAFMGCDNLIQKENGVSYVDNWVVGSYESTPAVILREDTVGIGAFSLGGETLKSIVIPKSVTKITASAIILASDLIYIEVAEGNPVYYSEGNCLIEKGSDTLIVGCKKSIIPNQVKSIGDFAFGGCTSLTNIKIPDSVTSIGAYSFASCTALTSITLPKNLTSIGDYAFGECSNLINITLSKNLTSIGEEAFRKCISLKSITIPDSVTSIGESAFAKCTALTSITLGKGVTYIGYSAFSDTNLVSIQFSGTTNEWNVLIARVSMKDFGSKIVYCANGNSCTNHTMVIDTPAQAPTCTSIGYTESAHCSVCENTLSVREPVEKLEHNAVIDKAVAPTCAENGLTEGKHCNTCGEILVPQMIVLKTDKHNYTSVTIPPTATENGRIEHACSVCGDCSYIISTIVPTPFTITKDNRKDVGYTGKANEKLVIPAAFKKNGTWYRVTAIDNRAFADCSNLSSISIPDSVTSVGYNAFIGCDKLMQLENGVFYVDRWAIDCTDTQLTVTLREGTVGIGHSAFKMHNNLLSVSTYWRDENFIHVGEQAFYHCENLFTCSINLYSSIGDEAFAGCTGLESFVIMPGITSIGDYAFSGCTALRTLNLVDTITHIGDGAFMNCSLLSFHIPDSITKIGKKTFMNCLVIGGIRIPDGVTIIDDMAFAGCNYSESITIPDSVTSIGEDAFMYCNKVTTITFEGTIAQWNAISKAYNWNDDIPATKVICSDGIVTLN